MPYHIVRTYVGLAAVTTEELDGDYPVTAAGLGVRERAEDASVELAETEEGFGFGCAAYADLRFSIHQYRYQ